MRSKIIELFFMKIVKNKEYQISQTYNLYIRVQNTNIFSKIIYEKSIKNTETITISRSKNRV